MLKWFFVMLLFVASVDLAACPLCLGAFNASAAEQLLDTQHAVLARPSAIGDSYRVVAVIKGTRPAAGVIAGAAVHFKSEIPAKGKTLLLVRDDSLPMWVSVGAIGVDHAGWLRQLAAGKHPDEMSAAEWRARVILMLPYLENPEPLVADIAYGEFGGAPYATLLTVKPRLSAAAIRGWLADPELASRQPVYLLLLGIAGNAQDADRLERQLAAAWRAGDATNLGAMIAADLQLRGPARMAWVDAAYMRDHKRTTPELEAALLALSVHGTSNVSIPRERVIESYRLFMNEHRDIAGFVARDLAAWQYWDAVPAYVALLRSDVRQQYPSLVASVMYVRQSPGGAAIELPSPQVKAAEQSTAVLRNARTIPMQPQ